MFNERLQTLRRDARLAAEAVLQKQEFVCREEVWSGFLDGAEHGRIPVQCRLPEAFPDSLPEVHVDCSRLKRRIPNVEKNGKLCIAPQTGILLDTSNPGGLIREALERARVLLIDGLSGRIDNHFQHEFLAYWHAHARETFLSICDPTGPARDLCLVQVGQDGGQVPDGRRCLVADSLNAAKVWLGKLKGKVMGHRAAFFLPLHSPFVPPDFDASPSVQAICDTMREHTTPEAFAAFRSWLKRPGLPVLVVLSLPLEPDQGHVLVAVRFEEAQGAAKKQALQGFRPTTTPAWRELLSSRSQAATLIRLERFDAAYLLPRGGATLDLLAQTIVVVGCGAVGSHAAERLASLGIGRLRLVDPDTLAPENVHRHALGARYVGVKKAEGMGEALGSRFPHLTVETRETRIETLLQTEPAFVTDADLLLIAVGDETLELRLNDLLRQRLPRLHAWLEPLGIGGHVLATGVVRSPGCFRCLFQTDATYGLTNAASFASPGQPFQRTYAGCAGTFTPFAGIDADRTAIEAATLAVQILMHEETDNVLVSWFGDPRPFLRAGFALSPRAQLFQPGERRRETRYARLDCPVCRDREP